MKKYILISLSILISLLACDKDEADRSYARIKTLGIQNINTNGVTISAEIYEANNLSIEDHGFVYNLKSSPLPANSDGDNHYEGYFEKESLGNKEGDGIFECTLTRNLIKDTTYLAKAYVVSNGTTTYGEAIEFESMGGIGPVITKIVPDTAFFGDTINIIGNNFSTQSHFNKISFNELEATVVYSSDTLIKTIIPEYHWKWNAVSKINMKLGDSEIQSLPNFYIQPPKIDSVSSSTVVSGMNVKLYGSHFEFMFGIKLDGKSVSYSQFDKISDSLISLKIPYYVSLGKISLSYTYFNKIDTIPDLFESTKPVIESVSPTTVWLDTLIQVKGPYVKYLGSLLNNFGSPEEINDSLVQVRVQYAPSDNKISGYYNSEQIIARDSIEWLPPIVKSIAPNVAYYGDKVTISGERFFDGLIVHFGDNSQRAEYIDKNTVEITIPRMNSGTYPIQFKYGTWKFDIQEDITFSIPEIKITNVNPTQAKRGDTIEISLENINKDESIWVYVDGKIAEVVEVNETSIHAKISNEKFLSDFPTVSVDSKGRTDTLKMALEAIESWKTVLEKENFHVRYAAIAYPNDIPVMLTRKYYYSDYVILQYNESSNDWDEITTYDLKGTFPRVVSKDDMMYFISHDEDDQSRTIAKIVSFSMNKKEWKHEGSFLYERDPIDLITFIKEDQIYVGDQSIMKALDLNSKTWEDKTNIPTDEYQVEGVVSFNINNRCYLRINNNNKSNDDSNSEFWEYDTNTDSWIYIPGCPVYKNYGDTFCNDNQKIYCTNVYTNGLIKDFWIFDTLTKTWKKYLPPAGRCNSSLSFTHNDFVYYGRSDTYGKSLYLSRTHINDLIKLEE